MDDVDRKILRSIQEDATLSLTEIAGRVGLSPTPCWRRLQKLEKEGVIRCRVALLDADKLNVGTTVFVGLKTSQHNYEWLEGFARAVAGIEDVHATRDYRRQIAVVYARRALELACRRAREGAN